MKKSDLYREWARVLDMCEGTKVEPAYCWKIGARSPGIVPRFCEDLERYEFAVAILEGKPVFVGDKVWSEGNEYEVKYEPIRGVFGQRVNDCLWRSIDSAVFSWSPPKKTFMLNGEELPCPDNAATGYNVEIDAGIEGDRKQYFVFKSIFDRNKVADAIIKLLKESTGNGE